MTKFSTSRWSDNNFAREYRDNADIYIVERQKMFDVIKSFYKHFLNNSHDKNILDLGCGDGILTHELLKVDSKLSATLIDGSTDMLKNAKKRLEDYKNNINFIKSSFQEIINESQSEPIFDLVVSAQAIHHLQAEEKEKLFHVVFNSLKRGGYFVNIDVVIAHADPLEKWYMNIWQDWMESKSSEYNISFDSCNDIIERYKLSGDNKPDTLEFQLNALKRTGFLNVDCYYKHGIFTIIGGSKEI